MRRTILQIAVTCIAVLAGIFFLSRPQPRHAAAPDFSAWTESYFAGQADLDEGIALARQRRAEMVQLIKTDPAKALDAALPEDIRARLPREIVAELETPFDGTGDLNVHCALRARKGPAVEPTRRFVSINGERYRAHLYGRRAHQTTKIGIPLRGIALDGHAAVDENALHMISAAEAISSGKTITEIGAPIVGAPASNRPESSLKSGRLEAGAPAFAELDNRVYKFASQEQLQQAEARIRAAEGTFDAIPQISAVRALSEDFDVAGIRSANTEGNKKVLYIRVDFSDLPGDAVNPFTNATLTAPYCQNLVDTVISPYFQQSSFGVTTMANTVTTQLYRMPRTGNYYAFNGADDLLHTDAQTLASANYNVNSYDRIAVIFPDCSNFPGSQTQYAGLADLAGKKLWINAYFDFATVAHELGHTYGLEHANLWKVNDGNPISGFGYSDEYGDDFDTMGANYTNDTGTDFNPWFKRMMNWIPAASVQNVTQAGTYRITRFDGGTTTGTLALTIAKDSSRTYWIACRRKITSSQSIQTGAYIFWGYNFNQQSNLLDFITPGSNVLDAPLPLNTNFHDFPLNLNILPIANGGTPPNDYIDVQISYGNATLATATTAADAVAAFSPAVQNIGLSAIVAPNAVNEGTVSFQVRDGATDIGTAVSGTVTNGNASVSYPLPAGTLPKTYSIVATYSGGTNYLGSIDSSKTLIVSSPVSPLFASSPSATPASPSAGQVVSFSAVAVSDPADTLTYAWTFGDGASDSGTNPTHTFAAPGTYQIAVTVSNGKGGSDTAVFSLIVVQPVYGTGLDSDGDGFSDGFENQYGTDPFNDASNPLGTGGGPIPAPADLLLISLQLKLNFIKPFADGLSLKATLPAPSNFSYANKSVYVAVGPKSQIFVLDSKGRTPKGPDSLIFTKPARGFARFTAKGVKTDLATLFVPLGVSAATPTGSALPIKITVFFNGTGYQTNRMLLIKSNGKAATLK